MLKCNVFTQGAELLRFKRPNATAKSIHTGKPPNAVIPDLLSSLPYSKFSIPCAIIVSPRWC
ncbi:hypothetical protein MBAV_005062 [Candidatus Magnetobacterium bavaricum]|uniref:Uncharacterized protein n=1 Tax=Candidatus Magnetobacterium bavaricum TaxID=29290 RepID=A0A0F3GPX9_9BACT|nr:hypothetical protein MBAV_005062 [Candidatus Magnetobacterium bavaricum]